MTFETGIKVVTCGINAMIQRDPSLALDISECLRRHENRDWGLVDEDERQMNDRAADNPESDMIMSVYRIRDIKIWIITDCGNEATTVLLPEEY